MLTLVESDVADTSGPQICVRPAINMPSHAALVDVVDVSPGPRVRRRRDIERVESHEDAGLLPERGAFEADILLLLRLRVIPRTDVHGIGCAAEDVFLVFGVGDPTSDGPVKRGIGPTFDGNGEAFGVNTGNEGPDADARSPQVD